MDSSSSSRRAFFRDGRSGLACIAGMEAGFSGYNNGNHPSLISRSLCSPRGGVCSSVSVSSPRSGRFYDPRFEDHQQQQQQPHFLESCFLCKKPLGNNRDIFMYRGDTPFCSEECRNEQIEIDEAKEKNRNLSSSMKAMRKKEQSKSTSPNKRQSYSFRTGTVAAA